MAFFVKIRGKVIGPLDDKQAREMVLLGKIGRTNMVSADQKTWNPAGENETFFPKVSATNEEMPLLLQPVEEMPKHYSGEKSNAPTAVRDDAWYVCNDGMTGTGPFSVEEITRKLASGELTQKTLAWHDNEEAQELGDIPAFASLFDYMTPPTSGSGKSASYKPGGKSFSRSHHTRHSGQRYMLVYIALGITLGWIGIHNFYAGYNKVARMQVFFALDGLILYLVAYFLPQYVTQLEPYQSYFDFAKLVIPPVFIGLLWLWGAIGACLTDRDADGNPLV